MVDFMNQNNIFNYKEDKNMQILQMEYVRGIMSMYIMLPKDHTGLSSMEKSMTPSNAEHMMKWLQPHSVDVKIPKFKVKLRLQPTEALAKMGIKDLFSSNSDLSGMAKERISVDGVFHEAVLEVGIVIILKFNQSFFVSGQ